MAHAEHTEPVETAAHAPESAPAVEHATEPVAPSTEHVPEPSTPAPEPVRVAEPVSPAPKPAGKKAAGKSGGAARKAAGKAGAKAAKVVAPPPPPPPPPEPVPATPEPAEPTDEATAPSISASGEPLAEQASATGGGETGEAAEDGSSTSLRPAPRVESGCHLDHGVLLASLREVQGYLARTDADQQTDDAFLGRLGDLVHVLGADMGNLRAYCQRAQEQLESIRSPIKDITDKIFRTISVAEDEEERRKFTYVCMYACTR